MMDIESERKAFETVFSRSPFDWDMGRKSTDHRKEAWPGAYKVWTVLCAWEAWQESAKHRRSSTQEQAA